MNVRSLRERPLLVTLAIFIVAIVAVVFALPARNWNQQDFRAGIPDSVASKTINVATESSWDVQIEITYSERQKQSYLDKVSRRIVSTGAEEAWRPIQHLPLALTVSKPDSGSFQVVHQETVENEPFYGGGDHAGFLVVTQLHLHPGTYVVSIRTLKGNPTLSEFGARLLVGQP